MNSTNLKNRTPSPLGMPSVRMMPDDSTPRTAAEIRSEKIPKPDLSANLTGPKVLGDELEFDKSIIQRRRGTRKVPHDVNSNLHRRNGGFHASKGSLAVQGASDWQNFQLTPVME